MTTHKAIVTRTRRPGGVNQSPIIEAELSGENISNLTDWDFSKTGRENHQAAAAALFHQVGCLWPVVGGYMGGGAMVWLPVVGVDNNDLGRAGK